MTCEYYVQLCRMIQILTKLLYINIKHTVHWTYKSPLIILTIKAHNGLYQFSINSCIYAMWYLSYIFFSNDIIIIHITRLTLYAYLQSFYSIQFFSSSWSKHNVYIYVWDNIIALVNQSLYLFISSTALPINFSTKDRKT